MYCERISLTTVFSLFICIIPSVVTQRQGRDGQECIQFCNHWSYCIAIAPIHVFAAKQYEPCPYFHLRFEWMDYYKRVLRFRGCDSDVCLSMHKDGTLHSDYDCDNGNTLFVQLVMVTGKRRKYEYKYMSATHKGRYLAISPTGVLSSTKDKSLIDTIFLNIKLVKI